ncbi:IS30 family transposase, partial [Limosilactobacillus reuteri]|nr:IS30 family transposase [Limosilactobacillus reuteri]MCC4349945.1 IS30 family transposase [Limosilactobacillus reuteri]
GAPNQRGLNENNNGLLRRDGLTKQLDFRNLPDELVTQLMNKRNNLPRKSLGYRAPYEVFMSYVTDEQLFSF